MHRLLSALLVVILVALTGCGDGDGRTRITLWHQKIGAERVLFDEAIADYNAQQDSVRVEPLYRENEDNRNLFVIASVGGKGPDVFFGPADNVGILALTETVRPITDVLPADYLAQFTDAGVVAWEGTPWLVGDQVGNHLAFVYNKALMNEPPATTDAMIEQLRRVQQSEQGVAYGLTWNYTEPFFFIPFLTGYGGWVMDEDGNPTLDTEATVKAIEFILALRDETNLIPNESDYNVAETLFKDARAASIINGPWAWAGYADAGVEYGLARIPKMSATGLWCRPIVSAKGYSVNVNVPDEKLPAIRDLLMYLTGPDMQRRMALKLATIPVIEQVRNSEAIQENEKLQASIRQAAVSVPMPVDPKMRQIWDGMRGPYQLIMNGSVTPEEGARLMQEEVEKRIADTFL